MRMIRRRRASAETDYNKRIKELKGGIPRLVVRKSNRNVLAQIVEYKEDGDKIVASANSKELRGVKWEPRCNIPTAYLTGMLLSRKWAKGDVVLDLGLYKPIKGSVVFAAAKGAQDGGMKVRGEMAVNADRISGSHIESYAKGNKERFSGYSKAGFDVSSMKARFEEAKKGIMSMGK
jgi:large subunit ribosomal protein L18